MQSNIPATKLDTPSPFRLSPITSLKTSRYDTLDCVQLCPRTINVGPVSPLSVSLVSKWERFVHPEGKPYFVVIGEFNLVVVTEANVEDVEIESRVLNCLKVANRELQCLNIKVPSRCELFLELGRDGASCSYYFVDHIRKGLFWLENLSTESLDISPPTSHSHLEMALERLYWVHVEFFPMHHKFNEQPFSQIVDDLYNIISHGQADRLTSRTSTFPYTADTCRHFLKLLSKKRGQRVDGYTLCYAARLAGAIMNQRFITFYGQQCAQLDRLQEVYLADIVEHKWMSTMVNLFMWGIPNHYNGLLKELYMNEQVYADQWTHVMSISLADWINSVSWSLPALIASILLANVRGGMVSTSIPSVLSCAVSIASASCLHLRHQPLAESSATVGARYLSSAKSNTLGFLPLSVAFSLPRACFLWGIGLLIAQFIFIISHVVNKFVAFVAASAIAGVLIFILGVIQPMDTNPTLFGSLAPFCNLDLYVPDTQETESVV